MDRHLELLHLEVKRALAGLDERKSQLRPANDESRWNIQQISGHLRLTYAATVEAMDARIAKGSPTKAKPSLVQYAAQFTLIGVGYFPRGRKAPDRVVAMEDASAASGDVLSQEIQTALVLMDARIAEAEKIFGRRHRVISHMVLGSLSLDQWRKFHLVHARHHIKQILAIRREHAV